MKKLIAIAVLVLLTFSAKSQVIYNNTSCPLIVTLTCYSDDCATVIYDYQVEIYPNETREVEPCNGNIVYEVCYAPWITCSSCAKIGTAGNCEHAPIAATLGSCINCGPALGIKFHFDTNGDIILEY